MKRILAISAIVALSATAFAGGSLDIRSEYQGNSYNTSGSTNKRSNGGFTLNRTRVSLDGKAGDVYGKMQLNPITGVAATLLQYAEVTNKWSDTMSLTAGKLDDTGMGGNEVRRSGGDQYFMSAASMNYYFGGLRFAYSISDSNVLKVYFMNEAMNGTPNTTGTETTATGYGLQYVGSSGDLGYIVSYHSVPRTTATASANTYMNLGLNYKMGDWMFLFDYNMNTYQKQSIANANEDASKTSMVLHVDYNMGNWTPKLKFESSTLKNAANAIQGANDSTDSTFTMGAAATDVAITQFSVGTEYKMNPADKYRYHIMYNSKSSVASGVGATFTNKTVTNDQVLAGFRWEADFLK